MKNKKKLYDVSEMKFQKSLKFGPQGGNFWRYAICDAIYTYF